MAPRTDGKVIEIRSRVIDRKLNKGGRKYFSTFSKFLHKYFARCYLSTIIGGIIVFFLLSVNRIRVRSIRKAGGADYFHGFPDRSSASIIWVSDSFSKTRGVWLINPSRGIGTERGARGISVWMHIGRSKQCGRRLGFHSKQGEESIFPVSTDWREIFFDISAYYLDPNRFNHGTCGEWKSREREREWSCSARAHHPFFPQCTIERLLTCTIRGHLSTSPDYSSRSFFTAKNEHPSTVRGYTPRTISSEI